MPKYRLFETHQKEFLFYERVVKQQPKDKNKIYSLHEPDVYCIGKGKDHKQYEYGNKVSIASIAKTNIIVGVASHERNIHDSHTLPEVLSHIKDSRGKPVYLAVCDRGYRGKKTFGETNIILPAPPLKKDNRYQRYKKRKRCRRRAAIEPIIGHLKTDFRLTRNFLKGVVGDNINLLMACLCLEYGEMDERRYFVSFCICFFAKNNAQERSTRNYSYPEVTGEVFRKFNRFWKPVLSPFSGLIN